MYSIGVDIVEVERIGQAVERWGGRFLRRVYTDAEIAYCGTRTSSLAARWAAKEAVSKALGTGWAPQEAHDGRLDRLDRDRGGATRQRSTRGVVARQSAGAGRGAGHYRLAAQHVTHP